MGEPEPILVDTGITTAHHRFMGRGGRQEGLNGIEGRVCFQAGSSDVGGISGAAQRRESGSSAFVWRFRGRGVPGRCRGCAAGAAYTASKHAVVGLTKNSAVMNGPQAPGRRRGVRGAVCGAVRAPVAEV